MKQKFSQMQTQQDTDLLEEGSKRAEKEKKKSVPSKESSVYILSIFRYL